MPRLLTGLIIAVGLVAAAPAAAQSPPTLGLSPACEAAILAGGPLDACVNELNPAYTGPTCESNPEREGCGPPQIDQSEFRHYVAYHRIRARVVRCKYGQLYRTLSSASKRTCARLYKRYRPRFTSIPDSAYLTRGLSAELRAYQRRIRMEEGWE